MTASGTPLRVTVVGIGYLGLTHAVCMADLGHDVLAIDVDAEKLAKAEAGEVPFFEPGLEPLLRKNLEAGRLRFTDSFAEVGGFGDVHFLCVGTPEGPGGQADLTHVYAAADMLAPFLARKCVVVGKSTVAVGTARRLLGRLLRIRSGEGGGGSGLEPGIPQRGIRRAGHCFSGPDRARCGAGGGRGCGPSGVRGSGSGGNSGPGHGFRDR